jgi:hypothetical protein
LWVHSSLRRSSCSSWRGLFIPSLQYEARRAELFAALDREQPVQFVSMGTSLAAAPGQ